MRHAFYFYGHPSNRRKTMPPKSGAMRGKYPGCYLLQLGIQCDVDQILYWDRVPHNGFWAIPWIDASSTSSTRVFGWLISALGRCGNHEDVKLQRRLECSGMVWWQRCQLGGRGCMSGGSSPEHICWQEHVATQQKSLLSGVRDLWPLLYTAQWWDETRWLPEHTRSFHWEEEGI